MAPGPWSQLPMGSVKTIIGTVVNDCLPIHSAIELLHVPFLKLHFSYPIQ